MTVVRSSVFTDWEGVLDPRRLLIAALNKVARDAITDLDNTVFPFFREHAHLLWSGVMSGETMTIYPKRRTLVYEWAAKYHLGPPGWLCDWIDATLHAWLTTDARLLLIPGERAVDSVVIDIMDDSQTDVLNVMRRDVTTLVSGGMPASDLVRRYGVVSMDLFRAALRRYETEIQQAGSNLGPSVPKIRLSFTPGQAEAAVRYQVLGESPEEITGGGRAKRPQTRSGMAAVDTDPSNLRKMIRQFLRAVEIEPRRSLRQ